MSNPQKLFFMVAIPALTILALCLIGDALGG